MLLSDVMDRKNNNLNLVRLCLAFTVIISHIPLFIGDSGPESVWEKLFPFANGGNIAVVTFFFLSGLFVTNALFEQKSIGKYVVSRFLRIYPPLVVCLILSVGVCFLFYSQDLSTYIKSAYQYIIHNLVGHEGGIEGVSFYREGYPHEGFASTEINRSIWTIPYEIKMYFIALILYLSGIIFKQYGKYVISIILSISILSPFVFKNQLLGGNSSETMYFLSSFSFGALMALYKSKIRFDWRIPVLLFLTGTVLRNYQVSQMLFLFALSTSCLYLSTIKLIMKIPFKIDISYGVYLYGWIIQQVVQYFYFSYLNWYSYAIVCCILSSIMGTISCYCVEKPCIRLKKFLGQYIKF